MQECRGITAPTAAREWTVIAMAKRIPKNNSYVCIPADKLAAIIEQWCPPIFGDVVGEQCVDEDCINCWQSWLKDGDTDG